MERAERDGCIFFHLLDCLIKGTEIPLHAEHILLHALHASNRVT